MNKQLPKSFRKFLSSHGDELLDTFVVYRVPLDTLTNITLQLLTAGDWEGIKKRAGVDQLFHTFAIINNKYLYEKTSVPVLKEGVPSREGAVSQIAPVQRMTIRDFVNNAISKMGQSYFSYNAFTNNCQDFLMGSLRANDMLVPAVSLFLKQDTQKIVEETPALSKYLAEKIVNAAGAVQHTYEEVSQKRGGIRHHNHRRKIYV
jgi:hypothetical protein